MVVFKTVSQIQTYLSEKAGLTIGFVPTMGALHEGHLSLIKTAYSENDVVFVSIFVNPTQFDNATDLEKYPRTLDNDVTLIEKHVGKDIVVFAPKASDIYDQNVKSKRYVFDGLEFVMEGEHRIGHFDGVGTILELLFNLIQPTNAYFGEKDFQQLQVIKTMTRDLSIPVEIVGVPTCREISGLAMSSRNGYLSDEQKGTAKVLFATLNNTATALKEGSADIAALEADAKAQLEKAGLKPDYYSIAERSTLKPATVADKQLVILAAAYLGSVRLIDNLQVELD